MHLICQIQPKLKLQKSLLHRHKLRAVVDDAALAIGGDLAEHTLDLHPDLRLCRVHDDLRRDSCGPSPGFTIAST